MFCVAHFQLDASRATFNSVAVDLAGRGAVVTGGGRGIGAACAAALARAGCRVVVSARSRGQIDAVARRIRRRGGLAWAVPCDVARPAAVAAMARRAERLLGRVDIVVAAAGIAPTAPLAKLTVAEWNRVLAVDLTGTFLAFRAFLPGMLARGEGRLIAIASTASLEGGAYLAAYTAAKHGVLGLVRSAAAELKGTGVVVNAVCPGFVDTEMTRGAVATVMEKTGAAHETALARILASRGQKRLVLPKEVAAAVLSLCGPRPPNGKAVVVDGK